MSRRRAVVLAVVLIVGLLLTVFAVKLADGTFRGGDSSPTITASPDVTLSEPEPMVSADSSAVLPTEPEPMVAINPAPISPVKVPSDVFVPAPRYIGPVAPAQPPISGPQLPLPSPQQPPVAPSVPLPQPVLPPEVGGPVRGLVGPLLDPVLPPILRPITDPLLK